MPDPIFIIGHWRSGTTYLHKLFSLDPEMYTPTLFDVALPDSCLTSYKFYKPIFRRTVPKLRPMDNVKMSIDEPQEDEYAYYRLTGFSPLERLIFPKTKGYFLLGYQSYLPQSEALVSWEQSVKTFLFKLYLKSGKPIVSKNPFNAMRILELQAMFPNAKFINITRDPFKVVPSTRFMFGIVQEQNALNTNHKYPSMEEVARVLKTFNEKIAEDSKKIRNGNFHQLKFEDLEKNPIEVMRTLYKNMGLEFSENFIVNISKFLEESSGYQKNSFELKKEDEDQISAILFA